MTPIDGLSFQLYSARTLEPAGGAVRTARRARLQKGRTFWRPFQRSAKAQEASSNGTACRRRSAHVGLDRLRADPVAACGMCRDLGIQTIYAPAPPPGERDGGEAEWTAIGRELDRIGKIVTAEGLKFGWHNHHWEYGKAADGKRYIDILLEQAPDLLWQADIAWIGARRRRSGHRVEALCRPDRGRPRQGPRAGGAVRGRRRLGRSRPRRARLVDAACRCSRRSA